MEENQFFIKPIKSIRKFTEITFTQLMTKLDFWKWIIMNLQLSGVCIWIKSLSKNPNQILKYITAISKPIMEIHYLFAQKFI